MLGSLLGLRAGRARETAGLRPARWLVLAAVALGGTGIWLTHFMVLLGLDVPGSLIRYRVPVTVLSAAVPVVAVGAGLLIVGGGRGAPSARCTPLPGWWRCTAGAAAIRLDGHVWYDRRLFVISVWVAVVAAALGCGARSACAVGQRT